jgi:hypothetical protein
MIPLYILLVIAGVGYYVNKKNFEKEQGKLRYTRNDVPSMQNIYESRYVEQADTILRNKATRMHTKSLSPSESGVVSRNHALNNMGQHDASGIKSNLAGVEIPFEQFKHNNMMPFFGGRIKQNMSETANQHLLEKYTGVTDLKPPKAEVAAMGDIRDDMGNVYGMTGTYQFQQDRMIPGRQRNNEMPFEKVYVGPGLDQGYSAAPSGGFQQADTRDFTLPKTVDDLRPLTRPKETFEGRNVDGLKTSLGGQVGCVKKNRVDTFYENSEDRYFVTTGAYTKEKKHPETIMRYTNRKDAVREYAGNVHQASLVGSKARSAVKCSSRQNLEEFGMRNLNQEDVGKGAEDDYGKSKILVYSNERDVTACRTYESNVTSLIKSIVAPFLDMAKKNPREYLVQNARTFGQLNPQFPEKPTMYDPNDIARTTIKETTIHDTTVSNLKGAEKLKVYDPDDITRVTMRQTLANADTGMNLKGKTKATVYDPNDVAKTTMKETTVEDTREGNIDGLENQRGGYEATEYDAKLTHKQFLSDNEYAGNVYVRDANGYKIRKFDPKFTQRVSTSDNDYYGTAKTANAEAQMSYEDAYNALIDDTKEMTLVGRAPTQTNVKVMSGGDSVNMTSNRLFCENTATRELNNQTLVRNEIPSKTMIEFTRDRPRYVEDTRLDTSILKPFLDNPFTHPLDSVA